MYHEDKGRATFGLWQDEKAGMGKNDIVPCFVLEGIEDHRRQEKLAEVAAALLALARLSAECEADQGNMISEGGPLFDIEQGPSIRAGSLFGDLGPRVRDLTMRELVLLGFVRPNPAGPGLVTTDGVVFLNEEEQDRLAVIRAEQGVKNE